MSVPGYGLGRPLPSTISIGTVVVSEEAVNVLRKEILTLTKEIENNKKELNDVKQEVAELRKLFQDEFDAVPGRGLEQEGAERFKRHTAGF